MIGGVCTSACPEGFAASGPQLEERDPAALKNGQGCLLSLALSLSLPLPLYLSLSLSLSLN